MKEIKLSFGLRIALKQTDVHWVEEELLRLREEIFLEVLRGVLREIEEEALKGVSGCGSCGCLLVRNGHEPKRIKTLIGTVQVDRVRLRCQGCGEDIYPLDEAMVLADGEGMTLGVRERALWAAVEVSYEKTSQFLSKFTGLEVSRKKVHQMAVEEGGRIEQLEEDGRGCLFEEGGQIVAREKVPEVLYIQVDGTGVNDRASRQWMECNVGASFSERVRVSKDRVCLMDKRSYVSIEGAEAFGEKFF
jgi:hypothetical protein